MLVWPWIFFGVVWAKRGVQMDNHISKVVRNHPQATTYFITFICSINSLIIGELFSLAIIRFAQELVTYRKPTRPFHLTVLLAFRRQTWPWGKSVRDAKYLMTKDRWWPALSVVICALIFPHLISSTTTLLTPTSFNRTALVTGYELDFSSTVPECLSWSENLTLATSTCGEWQLFNGLALNACFGGSQLVDLLDAGRGKVMESLMNNTEILTFVQLGAKNGLHFKGSVQGILPIGPNGVPTSYNAHVSSLSNPDVAAGVILYDYTVNQQGLKSNVSCSYAQTNPFNGTLLESSVASTIIYNVNCTAQGKTDALINVPTFKSTWTNNTLLYWACRDEIPTASYTIYLAGGLGYYGHLVGNIICVVNPIQSTMYSVMYRSTEDIFTATETNASSPFRFSTLINNAMVGLGQLISDSQNYDANLFVETILDLGLKFFDPPVDLRPPRQYLSLYEQMIQGIIEYEVTYFRLSYIAHNPAPPPSCRNTVTGQLRYEVYGWLMTNANIGFLIPITIINLGALFALYQAMTIAKDGGYVFHPSHPRPVMYDEHIDEGEQVPDEWMHKVSIRPTTVRSLNLPQVLGASD
ncbi:hypothetical protein K443DRAFT_632242 [Laccaria amethystina LaAM-08-1]|uniref:Uncharacterized protein n=1 Tax=Laccaria amethystina LaAM-08-1 TaxID=1095629 RepID=A0A0C9XI13_9AGAR|nr:hypothetical protein K443DRAFT_632242 [Laccaria amethystina LaAM-08-1]